MDYKNLPNVVKMYEQFGIDEAEALIIIGFMAMEIKNKLKLNDALNRFNKEIIPMIFQLEGE